jgi:hypothetical protein
VNDILVRMKLLAAQACAGEIPHGISRTTRIK